MNDVEKEYYRIARVCREVDSIAERGGSDAVDRIIKDAGFTPENVAAIAKQRALRSVMYETRGGMPNDSDSLLINLTPKEKNMVISRMAIWVDAFIVGITTEKDSAKLHRKGQETLHQ